MCTKFGAERPTSHFGAHVCYQFFWKSYAYYYFAMIIMCKKCGAEGRPLAMVAILVAILGKKVDERLHFNAKVLCAKFG